MAVPRKIIRIDGKKALLQDNRWVKLDLVPEAVVNDYVIVSADLAVEVISPAQAHEMSALVGDA